MTQQNTTDTSPVRHEAKPENRSRRNRRRRNQDTGQQKTAYAAYAQGTGRIREEPQAVSSPSRNRMPDTAQNDAGQDKAARENLPQNRPPQDTAAEYIPQSGQGQALQSAPAQDNAQQDRQEQHSQAVSAQDTPPQTAVPESESAGAETAQEPEDRPMESPAAAPETTVAESIDYQAAYQEIYRDILENLRSFSPSDQVACSITEEHISEYLSNSHAEKVMQFKERREKRFFAALELIAVLAAVVLVIHYLQNNSAILVNILYIIAGLGALFLWKFQPKNDDRPDSGSDKEAR